MISEDDRVRMISKKRDCRLMKCTTKLHGGECHRTSTPHKSVNAMKRKKIYNNHSHYLSMMTKWLPLRSPSFSGVLL